MAIPPSPPKLVRTRKQPLPNGYATNKAHKTESTPTSPRNSSQNEVQVPCVPLENDYNNLTTDVQAPPEEIVAEKANESPSNALNTTAELLSFDDDLIDTVDKSQADFNKMLDRMSSESKSIRMMNPFSDETVLMSLPEAGTAESESMISKPMGGIVKYFSKLKAAVGETSNPSHDGEGDTCTYGTTATSVYPELLKTKMDSIAKAFCSVELESTAKNSELPTNHLCTFIECTDPTNDIPMGTLPEHLHAPLNLNSPLNRSWFSLNEDSDSISKLSMPIGTNDMDLSVTSEMSPTPLMEKEPIAGFSHGETHL
ncbi:unnamed protein product [Pseudo-nitzschia multistriata]|uniref:Uncharacterized protein n=1 Tax=Pseudo-nitzschia multistriata TaxID=183589 RepID=A0A448ZRQ8_9STRA|nr:unnamed protein product [Pseudo-nitzschia multistriata]